MHLKFIAPAVVCLLISGCGPAPEPGPVAPGPAPSPWSTLVTGAGTGLAYTPTSPSIATPPLRLTCALGEFRVSVGKLVPIPSEDRLSIGFDSEPFALAVTPESLTAAEGIEATGPLTSELLTGMASAKTISGSYGAKQFGPYDAPPAKTLSAFVAGCRAASSPAPR